MVNKSRGRTMIIAVSGKGGTGKTVVASMLVKIFTENGIKDILAIDADPDSDLPEALGVKAEKTIGEIREELLKTRDKLPPGMLLQDMFQYRMGEATVETDDFDLIAMGRSEGASCYCAINNILRQIIDAWGKNYEVTIIDTEAGLEHLSRRTTRNVDIMLVVTDTSKRGITTVKRIKELSEKLDIKFKNIYAIINRASEEMGKRIGREIERAGIEVIGRIPEDEKVLAYDFKGKPLVDLPANSKALNSMQGIVEKLNLGEIHEETGF